jgi:hypothetical protein
MRSRTFSKCVFLALALPAMGFSQEQGKFELQDGNGSVETFSGGTHTLADPQLKRDAHAPSAQEQRFRVQWTDPLMVYFDWDSREDVLVPTEQLGPRRRLGIRGKLVLESADGKSTRPVTWLQGVRILLARAPDAHPDWSRNHDKKNCHWCDCVLEKDGSFCATFSPEEVRRPVGGQCTFQMAVCLGLTSDKTITWKNDAPILPQTLGRIDAKGPKPLSPTILMINGVPLFCEGRTSKSWNPVMLIRAVNHLHSLGKEKAIAELWQFMKIALRSRGERDPADIDTSDCQCVFLIVRLLFDLKDSGQRFPKDYLGEPSPEKEDESLWPAYPLAISKDVPFLVIERSSPGFGPPPNPSEDLVAAERGVKLRMRPLRPADNPISAIDKLLALPQTKRLCDSEEFRAMLRRQAWQSIAHLFPAVAGDDFSEAAWEERKKIAAKMVIRWDVKKQNYVAEEWQLVK